MKHNRNEIYNIVSQHGLAIKKWKQKKYFTFLQKKSGKPTTTIKNFCLLNTYFSSTKLFSPTQIFTYRGSALFSYTDQWIVKVKSLLTYIKTRSQFSLAHKVISPLFLQQTQVLIA